MFSRFLLLSMAMVAVPYEAEHSIKNISETGMQIINTTALSRNSIALKGPWEFYPNELIGPAEMDNIQSKLFITVPGWWTQEDKPEVQSASYRLKVILSNNNSTALALSMPDVYCSYHLWVNGKNLGGNGVVSTTKTGSKPQWKPETYLLDIEQDTLEIIIHLSNFHHYRTGISKPILLGQADQLLEIRDTIEISNVILLLGLALLSIAAIIVYIMRSKDVALLLFSLLCLSWMLRSAFSNHYQAVQWFPNINWYLCARMEYISIYMTTLFGSLLVGNVFPRDVNNAFRLFFIITCACFTLFTLLAPPDLFTAYVNLYLGLSSLLLIFIQAIIAKAYFESRTGAGLIMICALLAVIIFGYVILSYHGVFTLNELVFNIGFIVLFTILFIAVMRRIKKNENDNGLRSYDLR